MRKVKNFITSLYADQAKKFWHSHKSMNNKQILHEHTYLKAFWIDVKSCNNVSHSESAYHIRLNVMQDDIPG